MAPVAIGTRGAGDCADEPSAWSTCSSNWASAAALAPLDSTIDPAAHNERAIRCYEKAGFKRVGVMREYWLDAEGVWRDGLLLDMLATELTST